MRKQIAPRNWIGSAVAFDQELTIDAQISRDLIESVTDGGKQIWIPGEYYLIGKLRHTPKRLLPYVGNGDLLVDFIEFRIKCRLLDVKGNIASAGRELDGKTPQELWLRSGGEA